MDSMKVCTQNGVGVFLGLGNNKQLLVEIVETHLFPEYGYNLLKVELHQKGVNLV